MGLLGRLGIDLPLLAAQAVNFLALVWILKRFVYAPTVARIETDEDAMRRGEEAMHALEVAKVDLAKMRKSETEKARKESETIVEEARKAAKELGAEAAKESKRILRDAVAAAKREAKEEKASALIGLERRVSEESAARFSAKVASGMTVALRRDLQQAFHDRLLEDIGKLDLPKSALSETVKALERRGGEGSVGNGGKRRPFEDAVRDLLERKFGPVVLECAVVPTAVDLDGISGALASRLGLPFAPRIEVKTRGGLLAGYRLEAFGKIFEEHLAGELAYGFATGKS